MKKNLFLFCFIILLAGSCNRTDAIKEEVHRDSAATGLQTVTIDSISNPQGEADYIVAHLDDPRKPNIIINTYSDLLEKSRFSAFPAKTAVNSKDSTSEFFVTKQFYYKFLAAKPLLAFLKEKDEAEFMGDAAAIEIPEKQTFQKLAQVGEVVEMGPVYQYKLNDSVYLFTFSELINPNPQGAQFAYNTYLCAFDPQGEYIGGWETNYASYGNHGAGHESEAEITKDGKICISYSNTDGDTYLTTDIRTVLEITSTKHIKIIEYKKSTKKE